MAKSSVFAALVILSATLAGVANATVGTGVPLSKSAAKEAFTWAEGLIRYSSIINCVSMIQGTSYTENGIGTYVGFYADANAGQPAPGSTYYVHVVVAGLGNACSGQRAYIEIGLPASTSLAVTATNKINYYYDNVPLPANESPQTLSPSSYNPGALAVLSVDAPNVYTWPIPQGKILEIQIPVVSSAPLTNSTFLANVHALDGNSSPWLQPQVGVFVFSAVPVIYYSAPSTKNISTTSGHSEATVYTGGVAGTGYFDLGTTASYGLIHDPVTIGTGNSSWIVWDDWGPPALTPGTLYHWRFTFTTGGQTYYGADQTFTTLPMPVSAGSRPARVATRESTPAGRDFDVMGRLVSAKHSGTPIHAGSRGLVIRSNEGQLLGRNAIRVR